VRTLLFPAEQATLIDTWHTIGLRGTASDSYRVDDLFVPEAFSTTREDPTLRREKGPLYAFTMQGLYAAGVAAVALGIARAMLTEFVDLASRKAPRGLSRLADSALVQADVARMEARLGSARAYLVETLGAIYAQAGETEPIGLADRARVRLACTNAIHGAIEVADLTYKAAGVDAIFPGSPFERRFRDMHTPRSSRAAPISRRSDTSCSAVCPRCFSEARHGDAYASRYPRGRASAERQHGANVPSFDHLIGADEQRWRHGEAERLGHLHVDHEFEFCRLLDRQICGPGAFENLVDVAARVAEQIGYVGAIDDQSAVGELPEKVDRGQMMVCRERGNAWGLLIDEIITKHDHCIGVLGNGRRKGGIEFLGRSRLNDRQSHAEAACRAGRLLGQYHPVCLVCRVGEDRDF
jgi:hypothetical protein